MLGYSFSFSLLIHLAGKNFFNSMRQVHGRGTVRELNAELMHSGFIAEDETIALQCETEWHGANMP